MDFVEIGKFIDKNEEIIPIDYFLPNESDNIGNKVSDFEIIKFIGKGAFGKVYKVQSKINKKIYAMKIFEENIKTIETNIELCKRKNIIHRNIIKIYTYFKVIQEEKEKLYLIMEYMNNGNLRDFIIMNNSRKVENLLEHNQIVCFVLQTIWPLYYLHENGLILRNIKPENILIDENLKIKFGEFYNTIYDYDERKNEEEKHPYDIETNDESFKQIRARTEKYMSKILKGKEADVYALGKILNELIKEDLGVDSDDNIINNIIKMMLDETNENKQNNESGDIIYNVFCLISEIYSKRQNNSSIDAFVLCLKSFQNWHDLLENSFKKNNNDNIKIKSNVLKQYIDLVKFINDPNSHFKNWNYYINKLRLIFLDEINGLEEIEELEPKEIFLYLINIIINETKKNFYENNLNNCSYNLLNKENKPEDEYINENNFIGNSLIKKISGLMRIKLTCEKCKFTKYQFKNYILLELDPIQLKKEKPNDINNFNDILKFLIEQKEIEKNSYKNNFPCDQCFKMTEHKCFKEIYSLPDSLVISIKENEDKSVENCFIIDEKIKMSLKEKITKIYELVAILKVSKKINNTLFYSFSKFNGKWFLAQRYKGIEEVKMDDWHRRLRNVRIVFYQVEKSE